MSNVARNLGRLASNTSCFFLCDMQDKFRPSIRYFPEIITVAQRMVQAAYILDIPVIATEQYPKGVICVYWMGRQFPLRKNRDRGSRLGNTVSEIDVSAAKVFSKTVFSMMIPEVKAELLTQYPNRKSVVLFGIETQVCVQQTTLDLLREGFDVHIVADACSSRSQVDRLFALERMRQSGAFISTSESIIFELLGDSKHPKFKEVQALIKTSAPDSGLVKVN